MFLNRCLLLLAAGKVPFATNNVTLHRGQRAGRAGDGTAGMATAAVNGYVGGGAMITTQGWTWLNLGSLLPMGMVALAMLWPVRRQKRALATA